MKRRLQWRQLDLLERARSAVQWPQLDPAVRAEIVSLLKQLFNDDSAAIAKTSEATDE